MQTITFYAYKGGTGRSLVVANVAAYLARFGQRVFVLDLDLEAPGLHYKFSSTPEPLPVKRGVVDFFDSYVETGNLPDSVADFRMSLTLPPSSPGSIDLMPAGAAPSPEYWRKLAKLNWHELFYEPGAKGVAVFLELKERIRQEFKPDYLLIDARTGITEGGGIATNVLADIVVCLLINNRENLDGLRVVLRSIRRSSPPQPASSIKLIPVLTRIPESDDADAEKQLCDSVTRFLTEDAEDLGDTLTVSDVFVLHSQPDLQIKERLLVGGKESVQDNLLLRDYLKLFAHFIPREVLWPQVGRLLENAKAAFFDEPDGAVKEVENLATYSGHADVYRDLLKFYRARPQDSKRALAVARTFWDLARDASAPEFWDVVRPIVINDLWYQSKLAITDWRFIETVWRARGAEDVGVGKRLAQEHRRKKEHDAAADLLLCLVRGGNADDEVLAECVKALSASSRAEELGTLVEEHRSSKQAGDKFLVAWADAIGTPELVSRMRVTEDELSRLREASPATAYRVYELAGEMPKAQAVLSEIIDKAVSEGPSSEAMEAARLIQRVGRFAEFESRIRSAWPEGAVGDFLRHVQRDR